MWDLALNFQEQLNLHNEDFSGIMMVGVINKRYQSNSKIIGAPVNYTLTGGDINVRVLLDLSKRTLTVYTTNRPDGDTFYDLPKDGLFIPAI